MEFVQFLKSEERIIDLFSFALKEYFNILQEKKIGGQKKIYIQGPGFLLFKKKKLQKDENFFLIFKVIFIDTNEH